MTEVKDATTGERGIDFDEEGMLVLSCYDVCVVVVLLGCVSEVENVV